MRVTNFAEKAKSAPCHAGLVPTYMTNDDKKHSTKELNLI